MLGRLTVINLTFFLASSVLAQETNTSIVAKITAQTRGEFVYVEATARSKIEIISSIKYVLYTFEEDQAKNINRTEQSELLVLEPNEKKILHTSSFSIEESNKVTLMLLLYDDKGKLVGRDRKVILNDDELEDKSKALEPIQTEDDLYSGLLRGIVTEDTKTKPGRDFYVEFSSIYTLQQINGIEVVKVYERFSFGRNTIMEVLVGNTVVHRFFTQPKRDFLQDQAKIAIINVSRYFDNKERRKNYIRQY